MEISEYERDGFIVSTDRGRIDLHTVHGYLAGSYWAKGIPLEMVAKAVEHSLSFGV